jgi:hypothetical protein
LTQIAERAYHAKESTATVHAGECNMATFRRVVPIGQLAVTRRELEQAGAINIDWTPAGADYAGVTATMPDDDRTVRKLVRFVSRVMPPFR